MAEQSKKARHNNTCYHRKFCDLRIVLYVTVVSETTHEVGLTSWQKRVSTSSVIVLHRPVLEMSTATERAAKSHRQEFSTSGTEVTYQGLDYFVRIQELRKLLRILCKQQTE